MRGKTSLEQETAGEPAGTIHVDNCIAVNVLIPGGDAKFQLGEEGWSYRDSDYHQDKVF